MGSVEGHLGVNATMITSLSYELKDLWRSPRGTVLRIEALTLVAITLSFFLAFFGSCRRWSNRWIVQKGFLAAQVLSLSLGTYSIGLMQSSPVKIEMYPIWAVSLLTLFGCIDPVTTYIELDYKGPLTKMIFQLCLYFGYVMLMSVSTVSSDVGKVAIILLSTITFIKGFHRALGFVLPGEIREDIAQGQLQAIEPYALLGDDESLIVHLTHSVTMAGIKELRLAEGTTANGMTMRDVCLSYSFSHLLRKRFLGLDTAREIEEKLCNFGQLIQDQKLTTMDYDRALKVVEVELAFLFEAFFTSNVFLHLYQAKTGTFWALASFFGICFVGVVAATIPGAMASHHSIINSAAAATGSPGAGTSGAVYIVGTTTADLIVTLVILASLALLQLVQLIRCWTSNWARVGIACEPAIKAKKPMPPDQGRSVVEVTGGDGPNDDPQRLHKDELCSSSNTRSRNNQIISQWVMWLRLFLVNRVNWFDKYLWQARLGQDSLAALLERRTRTQHRRGSILEKDSCCCGHCPRICIRWLSAVGVQYFWRLINVLLLKDTTNPGGAIGLHNDVKSSITEFLGTIESRRVGVKWLAPFSNNGLEYYFRFFPYALGGWATTTTGAYNESGASFTRNVIVCHIATCYCEQAEKEAGGNRGGHGEDSSIREKNRRVAMDLSKYCVYLVVSAPELLPGPAAQTKQALDKALDDVEHIRTLGEYLGKRLRNEAAMMPSTDPWKKGSPHTPTSDREGEHSTWRPCSTDPWELLALLWMQTLLYAAPYGDVQAHMQHLAQGGEFITHLWALLYHLGIDKWKLPATADEWEALADAIAEAEMYKWKFEDMDKLEAIAEAEEDTTWEVQVEEAVVSGLEAAAETKREVQIEEDAISGSEIEEIN